MNCCSTRYGSTSMHLRDEQLRNALDSIESIVDDKNTVSKEVQFSNVLFWIAVIPSGSVMVTKDVQPRKAPDWISLTSDENEIDSSAEHFQNAPSPMVSMVSSITRCLINFHPLWMLYHECVSQKEQMLVWLFLAEPVHPFLLGTCRVVPLLLLLLLL